MISRRVVIASFLILICGLLTLNWFDFLFTPVQITTSKIIEIPKGANVKQIAHILADNHIYPRRNELLLWVYFNHYQNKLKTGEYQIQRGMTLPQIIQLMIMGKVIQHSFTVIPGSTIEQVVSQMITNPFLSHDTPSFDVSLLQHRFKTNAENIEGLILPDTYFFTRGTSMVELLSRAYEAQQKQLSALWNERSALCILKTPYEAVILASIIEKESCDPNEYGEISGVFMRRLAKNIPLQADPTVIYGQSITHGNIKQSHLNNPTPYNTYKKVGLPPTPIAIPSLGALKAALHPSAGTSLYFVAHPDGGRHVFSDTLKEHLEAVKNYRKSKSGN